jgi:TolB-like protein/class 3 adenylate cyclase
MAAQDQPTSTRKLAAILSADIVGYSALMGMDEEGTVRKLRQVREAVLPLIERFGGRVIDLAGDGILAEFPSAVRAVESAAAVQARMTELNAQSEPAMLFRIGVNVGDVIHEGERLYGDGINVAARLQAIAEPGRICISNKVHEEVRDRVKLAFRDMGDQELKNIARPVRAFSALGEQPQAVTFSIQPNAVPLALPHKPSIAVLPFVNLSGDPDQEYFADGVVEDVTTGLSRFPSLFVIARNSSFTYKGRAVDAKHLGRELGVRYVLEGSIRKSANRVRIAAQLSETTNASQIWGERFEGSLPDIFLLQDELVERVVGSLVPQIEQAEIERAERQDHPKLTAYDFYLRALAKYYGHGREENEAAIHLLTKATEADPSGRCPFSEPKGGR